MKSDRLEMEFKCYGCGKKVLYNPTIDHIPTGWRVIKLYATPHEFCDGCKLGFEYDPGAEHPAKIYPGMRDRLTRRHGRKFG